MHIRADFCDSPHALAPTHHRAVFKPRAQRIHPFHGIQISRIHAGLRCGECVSMSVCVSWGGECGGRNSKTYRQHAKANLRRLKRPSVELLQRENCCNITMHAAFRRVKEACQQCVRLLVAEFDMAHL